MRTKRVRVVETDKGETGRKGLVARKGFNREPVELMVLQALKIVEDMGLEWEVDHESEGLRDKFLHLAYHLDYLKRYCEGKV